MTRYESDITIVGGGVAGLWSAKEAIDRGLSVTLVEKSKHLADGATVKNEGWLHAGTYHAVSIENQDEILPVVANTRQSHEEIINFAPKSIDHSTTYALAATDKMAQLAIERWRLTGVNYREVSMHSTLDAELLNKDQISAIFEVDDKSINTRMLCQSLARYISSRGGNFLTSAHFIPNDSTSATVIQGSQHHSISSEQFLVTAGTGINEVVSQVTGEALPMRFFKAHLLVSRRLTTDNYFHLEPGEAGFMNHDKACILGINRDGIESTTANYDILPEKVNLIQKASERMLPVLLDDKTWRSDVMPVTCNKPDVTGGFGDTQSLDVNVFRLTDTYVCALPGKMTMAPYLAKKALDSLAGGISIPVNEGSRGTVVPVTKRPVDHWHDENTSEQYPSAAS